MTKLIKITNDYWGDGESTQYLKFNKENIESVIEEYTEDTPEHEGYAEVVAGVIGSDIYSELESRDWDDPSAHIIEIVDSEDEVRRLNDELTNKLAKLEEVATND